MVGTLAGRTGDGVDVYELWDDHRGGLGVRCSNDGDTVT